VALGDDVASFLLSTDTSVQYGLSRLQFSVDGMRVNSEGYAEMGHKIRQGAIQVVQATSSSNSQAAAVYTPARNLLSLPPGIRLAGSSAEVIGQQAGVVHEVTHALFDFHGYRTTNAVEEAVAYIAEMLYATARMLRRSTPGNPRSNAILTAALNVVTSRRMLTQLRQMLLSTSPEVRALADAVRAHPIYPDANAANHANGVFGGLMNPWYPSANFD